MSMMAGFSFTPVITFIYSFFILSILDLLPDLLSTAISVDRILSVNKLKMWKQNFPGLFQVVELEELIN
jgi:hypothetical protein